MLKLLKLIKNQNCYKINKKKKKSKYNKLNNHRINKYKKIIFNKNNLKKIKFNLKKK